MNWDIRTAHYFSKLYREFLIAYWEHYNNDFDYGTSKKSIPVTCNMAISMFYSILLPFNVNNNMILYPSMYPLGTAAALI